MARAAGLALAALLASEVPAALATQFLAVWAAVFLLPFLALGLLEPLLLSGWPRVRCLPARPARALQAMLFGAGAFGLLAHLWQAARCLGWTGGALVAICGGAAAAALLGARDETPVHGPRRLRALAGAATALAAVGLLLWADPEGRDGARHTRRERAVWARVARQKPGRPPGDELGDLELARRVAHTFMALAPPTSLRWSWEETVAVYGLLEYGRAAKDDAPGRYARAWIDAHAAEALEGPRWADHLAPAIAAALGPRGGPTAMDRRLVLAAWQYARSDAPRTRDGAWSHLGELAGGILPRGAWVDSLFMHGVLCTTLARAPAFSALRAQALEESARQAVAFSAALQDERTGLFRHAAIDLGPLTVTLPVEPTFWARGNAWAFFFVVEILQATEAPRPVEGVATARAPRVASGSLRRFLEPLAIAVLATQDRRTGLWATDLAASPSAQNPHETTASGLFAAALARAAHLRQLPAELRARGISAAALARRGLRSRIRLYRGEAVVFGSSTGTHPGFRRAYRTIPLRAEVSHGVGAVLLGLSARVDRRAGALGQAPDRPLHPDRSPGR